MIGWEVNWRTWFSFHAFSNLMVEILVGEKMKNTDENMLRTTKITIGNNTIFLTKHGVETSESRYKCQIKHETIQQIFWQFRGLSNRGFSWFPSFSTSYSFLTSLTTIIKGVSHFYNPPVVPFLKSSVGIGLKTRMT